MDETSFVDDTRDTDALVAEEERTTTTPAQDEPSEAIDDGKGSDLDEEELLDMIDAHAKEVKQLIDSQDKTNDESDNGHANEASNLDRAHEKEAIELHNTHVKEAMEAHTSHVKEAADISEALITESVHDVRPKNPNVMDDSEDSDTDSEDDENDEDTDADSEDGKDNEDAGVSSVEDDDDEDSDTDSEDDDDADAETEELIVLGDPEAEELSALAHEWTNQLNEKAEKDICVASPIMSIEPCGDEVVAVNTPRVEPLLTPRKLAPLREDPHKLTPLDEKPRKLTPLTLAPLDDKYKTRLETDLAFGYGNYAPPKDVQMKVEWATPVPNKSEEDAVNKIDEDIRVMMLMMTWLCVCEVNFPPDLYTTLMKTPALKTIMSVLTREQLQLGREMYASTQGEDVLIEEWCSEVMSLQSGDRCSKQGQKKTKEAWQ